MNLKAIAAAGALTLLAGSAHAVTSVTFYGYGVGAPTLTLLDNFSTDTVGSAPASSAAYSWTGGLIVIGSNPPIDAAPATGSSTQDTGNYLADLVTTTTTLTLAKPVSEIEVYVGSLDTNNLISFSNGDSFTGVELGALPGASASGNQTNGSSNGIFDFKFSTPVNSVTFGDTTKDAFEIASISTSAVPEPATWAMLIMGLFGLGAVMRRGRRSLSKAVASLPS